MPKILIIDDDPDISEAIKVVLETKNYKVDNAGSGEEGLKKVKLDKPDLIILDVMMDEPDDGFFLAQKFRKEKVKTPILMYTSVSKAIGFEFGAGEMVPVDDFVEKPISPDEIIEKVSRLLN